MVSMFLASFIFVIYAVHTLFTSIMPRPPGSRCSAGSAGSFMLIGEPRYLRPASCYRPPAQPRPQKRPAPAYMSVESGQIHALRGLRIQGGPQPVL
jgi:hypothetical protein